MQDVTNIFLPCCAICICLLWQINSFTGINGVSKINAMLFSFAVTHICINECKIALFMCLIGIYYNRGYICKIGILFYLFEPLCEKTSFTICKP